jgi:hypothetical protein
MRISQSLIRRVERLQREVTRAARRQRGTVEVERREGDAGPMEYFAIGTTGDSITVTFDIDPAMARRLNRLRNGSRPESIEGFRIAVDLVRDAVAVARTNAPWLTVVVE